MVQAWKDIFLSKNYWVVALENLPIADEEKVKIIDTIIGNVEISEGDIFGNEKNPVVADSILSPGNLRSN
jgi:hypothetical protein